MLKVITGKPTFASAMKTFTKAQEELAAAAAHNDAEHAAAKVRVEEAQAKVAEHAAEGEKISRVQTFFSNLLNGTDGVVTSK